MYRSGSKNDAGSRTPTVIRRGLRDPQKYRSGSKNDAGSGARDSPRAARGSRVPARARQARDAGGRMRG
eukprot:8613621-Pyramimonas_sp.AAC.1